MIEYSEALPGDPPLPPPVETAVSELLPWIGRLPQLRLSRAVPELILRLERLTETALDVESRYQLLMRLKGAVLRAASALPKDPSAGGIESAGLTLEQRLYEGMALNCRKLLEELDGEGGALSPDRAARRYWAVRNAFRFVGRLILSAARTRRPWPKGAWQELHDLYVYLVVRGNFSDMAVEGGGRIFEPEQSYKRLLVTGLVAETVDRDGMDEPLFERLASIGDRSALVDPDLVVGRHGVVLVEVGCDRPPRWMSGVLQDSFRGWVLRTPIDLDATVAELQRCRRPIEAAA